MTTDYLKISDVARLCNVSPDTVRAWIRSGRIVAVDVSGSDDAKRKTFVIHRTELQWFLDGVGNE